MSVFWISWHFLTPLTGIVTHSLFSGQLLPCLEKHITIFKLKCNWLLLRTASHIAAERPTGLATSLGPRHTSAFPNPFLFRNMGFCHKKLQSLPPLYWGCQLWYVSAKGLQMAKQQSLANFKSLPFLFLQGLWRRRISSSQGASFSPCLSPDDSCCLYNPVSPPAQPEFPAATSKPDYKSFWNPPAW